MDIRCLRCGEPWEFDYVLWDLKEDLEIPSFGEKEALKLDKFTRSQLKEKGWEFGSSPMDIRRCDACKYHEANGTLQEIDQDKLIGRQVLTELLGDDVDGIAAMMEDFDL